MNKKILGFSIIGLLILLMVYFVFASVVTEVLLDRTNITDTTTIRYINTSQNYTFNFTIDTNNAGANIIPVTAILLNISNATLGGGNITAIFINNTNRTNSTAMFNNGTGAGMTGNNLLNWSNTTGGIINGSVEFSFNFSVHDTLAGTFNFTIYSVNQTNVELINITQFIADNDTPIVSLTAPTNNSWEIDDGNVTFQYVANDSNLDSCVLWHNASGSWAANTTNSSLTSGTKYSITLAMGDAFLVGWRMKCNDSAGKFDILNETVGDNYTINIDAGDPTGVTASVTTTGTIYKGNTVTIACTGSDAINSSLGYLYEVKGPLTGDTYSTTGTSFTGTNEVGTYSYKCTATDWQNHSVTSSVVTFAVTKKTQTYASGGAAGAAPTVAIETIRAGRTSDVGILTESGISKLMATDSTLTFTIDTVAHSAKVTETGVDYVVLEISSDPMEVTVKVNESKKVDLDNDGVNDLEITLHGISYGKGDLTFKRIEEVAEEEVAEEEEVEEEKEVAPVPTKLGLWITILVIIVVVVVGYYMVRKRKGKKAQVKFTEKELK